MLITRATPPDAAEILDLQRLAYQSEAAIYDDFTIPPLVETVEDLRSHFGTMVFLKAVEDAGIVGSVRAYQEGPACCVQRLVVHPDYRRRGIGGHLLTRIEAEFPSAGRFELFTGHRSVNNVRLYERLGYRIFKTEPVHDRLTLVFLAKQR
jgi:ribosomal protein S18 acetylase RimI-like enzyme